MIYDNICTTVKKVTNRPRPCRGILITPIKPGKFLVEFLVRVLVQCIKLYLLESVLKIYGRHIL